MNPPRPVSRARLRATHIETRDGILKPLQRQREQIGFCMATGVSDEEKRTCRLTRCGCVFPVAVEISVRPYLAGTPAYTRRISCAHALHRWDSNERPQQTRGAIDPSFPACVTQGRGLDARVVDRLPAYG